MPKGEAMLYTVDNYNYAGLAGIKPQARPQGLQEDNVKTHYADIYAAFDIETTRLPDIEQSIMYVWQFALYPDVIIGRTWKDFKTFLWRVSKNLPKGLKLIIWDHNLSYEWNWLQDLYDFKEYEVFALDAHEVIRCSMYNRFEFRCSYKLTNLSLAQFCAKYHAEHQKLSGDDFNYTKLRYPWTPLTDEEIEYCAHDVLGLCEAVAGLCKAEEMTFYELPHTETGFIRSEVNRAMHDLAHFVVRPMSPDYDLYRLMQFTFRGGNTHANRFFAGYVCKNVWSADRSSSYPDVMVNCVYPMSKFERIDPPSVKLLHDYIYRRRKAVIAHIRLENVRLKDYYNPVPYIARAKCEKIPKSGGVYDNGRVIECPVLECGVTDIDYRIIREQYDYDLTVLEMHVAKYGRLPKPLRDEVLKQYKLKTELKGAEPGSLEETLYNKAKARLNSIYGLMVQAPVRAQYKYRFDPETDCCRVMRVYDYEEKDQYARAMRKAHTLYCWGLWVTAWARLRLQETIDIIRRAKGENGEYGADLLYTDTDSVKYIGKADFTQYNADRITDSEQSGAYAYDRKGKVHYMGVLESENAYTADGEEIPAYSEFKTLGAKKYVYVSNADGKLHCTIAGVNKRLGAEELTEAGGIKAFQEGFTFTRAGGVEAVYNDKEDIEPYKDLIIDGHKVEVLRNVCLRHSTYTVGITAEYDRLLKICENDAMKLIDFWLKCQYTKS